MRKQRNYGLLILLFLVSSHIPIMASADIDPNSDLCSSTGKWIVLTDGAADEISHRAVIDSTKNTKFVLLGEHHDQPQHHRWQTQMLSALLSEHNELAIGLEMLPRSRQPVLNSWVAREISLDEFVEQSGWYEDWRFDIDLYLPILNFARDNGVSLHALNVPRVLISKVSQEGWSKQRESEKHGIETPAPAKKRYEESLSHIYEQHERGDNKNFSRFIEAQLVWDRAFAQGLVDAQKTSGKLVVGIIGSGHLNYGYGVKHQLEDLGETKILTWLPADSGEDCLRAIALDPRDPPIADAIFLTNSDNPKIKKHKLGIYLIESENGPVIADVMDNSIAIDAGLLANDTIVEAAGRKVSTSAELVKIINRQAAGYLLPLKLLRNGDYLDIVAKIPIESN